MAPTKRKASTSAASAAPARQSPREWSIEQETVLFRAICRFKPAGQHKHFRMLSIYQMVNNSNIASESDGPVSMPEIWEKLKTLYNLEGLDELEDSSSYMASEEQLEEEFEGLENEDKLLRGNSLGVSVGDGSYLQDFYLPYKDYGDLIEQQASVPDDEEDASDSDASDGSQKAESPAASDSENPEKSVSEQSSRRTTPTTERPTKRAKVTKKAGAKGPRMTRRKAKEEAKEEPKSPSPENEDDKAESAASEPEEAPKSKVNRTTRSTRNTKTTPAKAKSATTTPRRSSRRK